MTFVFKAKPKVTIMKNNILWLVAGFIGVAAAASVSVLFEQPWVGYFFAFGLAVIIFLLMAKSMMQKISSTGMKKTMVYLFGF